MPLDGREFQAHAAATGKARSPIVDRPVDGTVSVDVLADRRRQQGSSINFSGQVKCLGEVRRRLVMEAAMDQNTQPEFDSLRNF